MYGCSAQNCGNPTVLLKVIRLSVRRIHSEETVRKLKIFSIYYFVMSIGTDSVKVWRDRILECYEKCRQSFNCQIAIGIQEVQGSREFIKMDENQLDNRKQLLWTEACSIGRNYSLRVPPRSVLQPLLFPIYINDLAVGNKLIEFVDATKSQNWGHHWAARKIQNGFRSPA